MVARVTRAFAMAGAASTSWYGDVVPTDDVLRIQKFDPVVMGGTTFELRSDRDIAIFAEDVRAKLVLGDDIKHQATAAARGTRDTRAPAFPALLRDASRACQHLAAHQPARGRHSGS